MKFYRRLRLPGRLTVRFCFAVLALSALAFLPAQAQAPQPAPFWDTYSDTWVGEDALGRPLPTAREVGGPKPNKQAGIFYYLWLGGNKASGPFNNTEILQKDPDALNKPGSPLWGGLYSFHYWNQPLFGYYSMQDPFIVRKHAQMLTDAGVTMLLFDTSNGYNYEKAVQGMITVYLQMRAQGMTTPQLAFHAVAGSGDRQVKQVTTLYHEFYEDPRAAALWFRWGGKPLIIAKDDPALPPEIRSFFTFRTSYWDAKNPNPGSWNTDGWYPVQGAEAIMRNAQGQPEQTAVSVSSSIASSPSSNMGPGDGRSWRGNKTTGYHDTAPGATARGEQFQDCFDAALAVNPPFLLFYDWNEWVAQRFLSPDKKKVWFVDEFSDEYSKDTEPMRGGFGDNYYYQLTDCVRHYTGVRSLPPVTPKTLSLSGGFGQWQAVQPEFRDDIGDPVQRDFEGWNKSVHYTNQTGRNDIVASKATYDAKNIYFYVRTRAALTPRTDPDWMRLYLNTDGNYQTGWLGYDYVINRTVGTSTTSLERSVGGKDQWRPVAQVRYVAQGSQMMLAIPRAALGLTFLPPAIDFKWADHCHAKGDWTDFTLNGDAAPNDRFNYRAVLRRS